MTNILTLCLSRLASMVQSSLTRLARELSAATNLSHDSYCMDHQACGFAGTTRLIATRSAVLSNFGSVLTACMLLLRMV